MSSENENLPQLSDEQNAALVRRASQFKPSGPVGVLFGKFLEDRNISEAEWRRIVSNPEIATAVKKEFAREMDAVLPLVHQKLLEEAVVNSKGWAYKMLLERWDKDYVPRKQNIRPEDEGNLTVDRFDRSMRLWLKDKWDRAKDLAAEEGERGGVFGEEYLPGGRCDGEEIVDAEFSEASRDDPADAGQPGGMFD